jgi:hypothetical protein
MCFNVQFDDDDEHGNAESRRTSRQTSNRDDTTTEEENDDFDENPGETWFKKLLKNLLQSFLQVKF